MPSDVVGEGDIDRAVIAAIAPGLVRPRDREEGREAAIRVAAAAAKLLNREIVLVLDRNAQTPERLAKEVEAELGRSWGGPPARHEGWFLHGTTASAVRLVIAGLPDDPTLKELGVSTFAIDDYLLLLCLDPEALDEYCKKERLAHRPRAADLRATLEELAGRLRARQIEIDSSKRYMDLVRAVVGFPASRAKFAEDLIRRCPAPTRERVLGLLAREVTTDPPLPPAA